MSILSKISYVKIKKILTRIKLRGTLNILGIIGDKKTSEKNKKDISKASDLVKNLSAQECIKLDRYLEKKERKRMVFNTKGE